MHQKHTGDGAVERQRGGLPENAAGSGGRGARAAAGGFGGEEIRWPVGVGAAPVETWGGERRARRNRGRGVSCRGKVSMTSGPGSSVLPKASRGFRGILLLRSTSGPGLHKQVCGPSCHHKTKEKIPCMP
jgi:hypothetical protein